MSTSIEKVETGASRTILKAVLRKVGELVAADVLVRRTPVPARRDHGRRRRRRRRCHHAKIGPASLRHVRPCRIARPGHDDGDPQRLPGPRVRPRAPAATRPSSRRPFRRRTRAVLLRTPSQGTMLAPHEKPPFKPAGKIARLILRRAFRGNPLKRIAKYFGEGVIRRFRLCREHAPHLVHSPRDRRFRYAQDLGRFRMGELLAGDQHRSVPKCRLQPRDRALQPDRVIEVAAVRLGGQAGEHRQPLGECAETSRACAASRGRR